MLMCPELLIFSQERNKFPFFIPFSLPIQLIWIRPFPHTLGWVIVYVLTILEGRVLLHLIDWIGLKSRLGYSVTSALLSPPPLYSLSTAASPSLYLRIRPSFVRDPIYPFSPSSFPIHFLSFFPTLEVVSSTFLPPSLHPLSPLLSFLSMVNGRRERDRDEVIH